MVERTDTKTWGHRAAFVLLAFVIVVAALVPLDLRPQAWAGPDVLLAVTLAWVARKPSYLPVAVVAALFLMADILYMRPPGLRPALVVILTEVIRRQNHEFRNMPLLVEWSTIAGGIVIITILNSLVLFLVMLPPAPAIMTLTQLITTILVYPLVLLVAHFVFGVTRTAPGETGSKGHLL